MFSPEMYFRFVCLALEDEAQAKIVNLQNCVTRIDVNTSLPVFAKTAYSCTKGI